MTAAAAAACIYATPPHSIPTVPPPACSQELRRRSEISSTTSSWAIVDYPPYLGRSNGNGNGNGNSDAGRREGSVDTAEAWAAVTASSACLAVEAVRTALVGTNRHLVRTYCMCCKYIEIVTN